MNEMTGFETKLSKLFITWDEDYKVFVAESMDNDEIRGSGETVEEAINEYHEHEQMRVEQMRVEQMRAEVESNR